MSSGFTFLETDQERRLTFIFDHNSEYKDDNSLPSAESKTNSGETRLTTPDGSLSLQFFVPPGDTTKPADSTLFTDSLGITDSLALADTIKIDSAKIDSTARLNQFKYKRTDPLVTEIYNPKGSSLFPRPNGYKKTIEIDSSGQFVTIKEFLGNQLYRISLRIPIEEYLSTRLSAKELEMWETLAYKYELKSGKKDLSDLIKDITDFEIPLPSVGVLSIFGPPIISLKIGGAVDIRAAWRNESTEGITASRIGNTRNEPDFRQQVQINVNGTIGDKLLIGADWNTERTFEYQNQLKIKYTGYEDEIIQKIEAGNVSLQTSSLVGGSEALFGVKADMKLGPLTLTTLVSQKKAEVKEKSVESGKTSQEYTKRAYDYSINHYFLDTIYADTTAQFNLFFKYYGNPTPIVERPFVVKDIEVWKSINQTLKDPTERSANAYIDLPPRGETQRYPDNLRQDDIEEIPGQQVKGRFIRLNRDSDYILHEETGYITFRTQIQDQDIIAVSYRVEGGFDGSPADDQFYGEFLQQAGADTSQRLILKLVKPANLQPSYTKAWKLLLKNIYPVGGRNLKEEGFTFDLKYEVEGNEPQSVLGDVRLLNAFGLDQVGPNKLPPPDGKFDYKPQITIIPETGEIIFPYLQPFGRNLPPNLPNADSLKYLAVYDQSITFARQDKIRDKFILTGTFSGESASVFQLGFNMVENSVKVLLDGRELTPGTDYVVDYNIGQLTIRNAAALSPGANLKITYEENDLFQLASKTLFGIRGLVDISKKTKLGFSFLNLSQQTLSDKVRIGEEPLSNAILGVDFQTSAELPVITRLIDEVLSTREMSSISLTGEFAYMMPDPNTKKSNIASDAGKSIAYIDDFEGAKRTIPVGISYGAWKDLSVPDSLPFLPGLTRQQKMAYKGKSWWFNVLPSDVVSKNIWPQRYTARGDDQVTVLDFVFQPDTPGTYNYDPNLLLDKKRNWGGMMKLLSSTASNLVDENIEFIEFWLNIRTVEQGAKLYIDLGKVSEDVIPNNRLDSEDRPPQNDLIDEGEDTGIDGLFDAAEQTTYGSSRPDPSQDNFSYINSNIFNIYNYFNINGTQGNAALTDIGRIPDTEDLNKNGSLDQANSYFRYVVPLDTVDNPYIKGGGNNAGWYLYRIPLKDFSLEVGKPTFTLVEFIRIFMNGTNQIASLRFADFNLVGNQWRKAIEGDSILSISVVNVEDNPNYSSPPGVERERDRSRPDQEIFRNEQALSLILKELPGGEKREAVKYLFRPLDIFNYTEMKLFIHGDSVQLPGSISYNPGQGQFSAEVYYRFGADTNNYYEYRQPVQPGWNEISIEFAKLTAIKQTRDSANVIFRVPVDGKPGHFYVVKGNPSLTTVKFLSVGIQSLVTNNISGEVWVNELRVIGADNTPGWAYTASSTVKLADLITISANLSQTDPYFHRLADRFGSRVETRNWGFSTDIDVLKFIPVPLPGSNLKINYSRTESVGNPLYIPGTDIKVSQAAEQLREKRAKEGVAEEDINNQVEQLTTSTQTLNTSDTWTISNIQIKVPSEHWFFRDVVNSLSYGFNYNKSFSRNPTTLSSSNWIWNANINYALNLNPDYYFEPGKIPIIGEFFNLFDDYKDTRIYFTPQTVNWNVQARRQFSLTQTRTQGTSTSQETISRDFTANRTAGFNWKITEKAFINVALNYNFDIASSLTYLETDEFNNPRAESAIWSDIFGGQFFGRDFRYNQSFDLRTNPRLPSWFDLNKYLQITAGYNVRYNWNNDFRQAEAGRSAGFQNRTAVGFKLRLKALTEPLFKEDAAPQPAVQQKPKEPAPKPVEQPRNRRTRDFDEDIDNGQDNKTGETQIAQVEEVQDSLAPPKPSALKNAFNLLKTAVQVIFFDYENISVDYSNDISFSANGIRGYGNGFKNFWGVKQSGEEGPARLFMLGLSLDPGPRAANSNLTDNYSERNNIDIRTSKPLWEGARIDLTWRVNWSINKSVTLTSDEFGNTFVNNISSTGAINRSFFSLPPVFIFSVFGSGIKKVNELYNPDAADPTSNLSSAFVKGMESLPLLSNLGFLSDVANYIPRPNWRISWDGLEKLGVFSGFAKRVSLDHSYASDYTEGWKITPDGTQVTQNQKISYSFAPLIGLNLTFNELWGGNLSGSVKYSSKTSYDLGVTTKNITESNSREIGITLNYNKSGFEVPLFGINLKNDIEFSFLYSLSKNSSVIFDMNRFTEEGIPQNGTNTVQFEPRIKYVISSRVTLSIFYKRSETTPEGASRIPPTTRNEAGLDIRISIQ